MSKHKDIGVGFGWQPAGKITKRGNNASYRKSINRRLKVMAGKTDRESVLVQLRRERGLTSSGDYRLPLVSLNKLLLQSGLTIGFGRLILFIIVGATVTFTAMVTFEGNAFHAFLAAFFSGFALPPLVLKFLAAADRKSSVPNFPMASTSSFDPCGQAILSRSRSRWCRRKCRILSAPSSALYPMNSLMDPILRRRCAISFSASEPMICLCLSRRWPFSEAAISERIIHRNTIVLSG